MGEKGNPEPNFISQVTKDPFESDRHEDIIQKIAHSCKNEKEPVNVQKDFADPDIIDRNKKEKYDDDCNGRLDNFQGIFFKIHSITEGTSCTSV